jgi:hypothetical protein
LNNLLNVPQSSFRAIRDFKAAELLLESSLS